MTSSIQRATPPVYARMRRLFAAVVWLLLKPEVSGLENVPAEGGFLLVMNHLAMADPTLAFVYLPRQVMIFAADKWRSMWLIRWVVETIGVIWVARGEADRHAIRQALEVLRSGWVMGMAPEGTRSPTRALQAGKTGAAYLADRAGVPLVPVAVWGTEQLTSNVRRLRRTPVRMAVGPAFRLPTNGHAKTEDLAVQTDEIMCRIAALLPPQYRGVYAEHPRLTELLRPPAG
ncbi:MAG: 1-acyl-sn-glycerol-3-phosphate acyltransferase [Anaerolineales bacterium]|nr:1-acyl-sn-glycerol-3-phosphate acyltransferase [Anaerolineales bacterium]